MPLGTRSSGSILAKTCRSCGSTYQARSNSARYCSSECSTQARLDRQQARRTGTRDQLDRKRERDYASRVMREYGITMEERQAIIDDQGGHCALCPATDSPENRLCIDHAHDEPNKRASVRAVVCRGCNVKIGRIERYLNLPRRFAG